MATLELVESIEIEEEVTDEKIYAAAYSEWVGVLASMWDAIGKDVDEKRLKLYASQFSNIPFGLLEKAVARSIRNNGNYLTVPTVGALWDAIKKEAGEFTGMDFSQTDVLEAVEVWHDRMYARLNKLA